jgi:RimJ/RimL family protein N-acetyltransferase
VSRDLGPRRFDLGEVTLVGRFVRLEPLSLAHVPGLARAADARDTYAITSVPDGEAAMRRYVDEALAERAAGRALPFATIRASDDQVVGSTRLGHLEYWTWPDGRRARTASLAPDAAEIGWTWLSRAAQRTAINTSAKRLMLGHAFDTWGVVRVHLKTDERNLRSRAAIERLGAKLDGLLRAHMLASDGTPRTSAWYSILASEWPAVRAHLDARLDAPLDARPGG